MGITAEGKIIYDKLLPSLLPHYPSQYLVVNTQNAEYWVDSDLAKALQQAKAKFPDVTFFIAKIGAEEGAVATF